MINKVIIQYRTDQILTNKNNPTEMNHQLRKIEILQNQTQPNNPEQTLSLEQKLNLENLKRIMKSGKTTLPSLRNIECRTVKAKTNKVNQILTHISTKNITELNEPIYAEAK